MAGTDGQSGRRAANLVVTEAWLAAAECVTRLSQAMADITAWAWLQKPSTAGSRTAVNNRLVCNSH